MAIFRWNPAWLTTSRTPGRDTILSAALHRRSDADLVDLAHYFATLE